jgi:hypothetical protein
MKPKPPGNGLSMRANRGLTNAGIPAEKEAVLQALLSGALSVYSRPRNYGKKTHEELCRWVGLPEDLPPPRPGRPLAICPCCGSVVPQSDIKGQADPPASTPSTLTSVILHHTKSPSDGLSPRTKRCLAAAGIPLEKQAVLDALRTGALSTRTTLYGKYTHRDVCRWLGLDESFRSPIIPEDTRPPFIENGLSYRANGLLHRAGIPAEKPAVRHALQTGALVPEKRPYNYGKQTHAELCRWAAVDPSALPSS